MMIVLLQVMKFLTQLLCKLIKTQTKAFQKGDPYKLIRPTDSNGNICGMGNKTNEPILLYFDILQCTSAADLATSNFQCPTYAKCVNTCPDSFFSFFTHVLPGVTAGLGAFGTPLVPGIYELKFLRSLVILTVL